MITPEQLRRQVLDALRSWYQLDDSEANLLDDLLLTAQQRRKMAEEGLPDRRRLATNRVLEFALEELEASNPTGASILRRRFLDGDKTRKIAQETHRSEDTVNHLQRQALDDLATIIARRDNALRAEIIQTQESVLPPSQYTRLFGVETARGRLLELTSAENEGWVISVSGIGGIGKTALCDLAVREVIGRFRFDQVIWLRLTHKTMSGRSLSPDATFEQVVFELARQLLADPPPTHTERRSLLRRNLKSRPSLVVIDNVEEDADVTDLYEHLADLARPSRFLVTTRAHPTISLSVPASDVRLSELSRADSLELMRYEAGRRGLDDIAQSEDEVLAPALEAIGGNPLALKLTIALAELMPLPDIVADMKRGRLADTREMYYHIYRKAMSVLSENALILLESLPLVGEEGGLPDQLQAAAGLSEDDFWGAVKELTARSLLEARGTALEKRYGIHRLTETFLQTEVVRWPEELII